MKRQKIICFAVLLYLMCPVASQAQVVRYSMAEKAWLNTHQVLHVGVVEQTPPILFYSGTSSPQGLVADYLRALALHLGLQLEISLFPDTHSLTLALVDGKLDAVGAEVMGLQGQGMLIYTRPYLTLPVALFAAENIPQEGLGGLRNKTIAVVRGSVWEKDLPLMVPGVRILPQSSIELALRSIAEDRAFAYLGDAASANYLLKRQEIGDVEEQERLDLTLDVTLATRAVQPELQSLLQKGFDRIGSEELQEIWRRWPGVEKPDNYGKHIPPLWIWGPVLVAWTLIVGWAVRFAILHSHDQQNGKLKRAIRRLQRREKRLKQKLLLLKHKALEYRSDARQHHQRLRLIDDVMPNGAWVWETSQAQCQWDEGMYALYRQGEHTFEPTSQAILQCVHAEDREKVAVLYEPQEGEGELRLNFRIVLPDGQVKWLLDYSHFSRNDDSDGGQRVGICWDISDYMTLGMVQDAEEPVES